MSGNDEEGGAMPPQPPPIDVEGRWNLFLAKRAEVEKAFRETLDLPADLDLSRFAQPFAMAALPPLDEPEPPRPPGRATDQQVRRGLLRIEKAARGAMKDRPRKDAGELLRLAINDAPREVKAALPGAIVLAALLHGAEQPAPPPLRQAVARLAADAAAIAATIPPAPHPGGRRPAKIDETALAIRLAQAYTVLTGNTATVSNRDLDEYATSAASPFMALIDRVFCVAGLTGSPRKAAERAVEHIKVARNDRGKNANE